MKNIVVIGFVGTQLDPGKPQRVGKNGVPSCPQVYGEITRLRALWEEPAGEAETAWASRLLAQETLAQLDLFDRLQLEAVVKVCRECDSLSEAGRRLFAVSRAQRGNPNDADRLRKFLAGFGLDWKTVLGQATS